MVNNHVKSFSQLKFDKTSDPLALFIIIIVIIIIIIIIYLLEL